MTRATMQVSKII